MCGALPAGRQLEPTTSKEHLETDEKNSFGHIMIVHVLGENGDRVRATAAFLQGVVCPPCHAYARTARVEYVLPTGM